MIRITSQPIKYNIQTQSARLEMEVPKLPKGEMSHDPTRRSPRKTGNPRFCEKQGLPARFKCGMVQLSTEDTSEITFVSPILGFENQSRFVFLNDDSIGSHFAFLQSLEEPELCPLRLIHKM